ncbi:MAG: hypothetical protein AB7V56_16625 [Candidatus Nitrosocosmicus sp.]
MVDKRIIIYNHINKTFLDFLWELLPPAQATLSLVLTLADAKSRSL